MNIYIYKNDEQFGPFNDDQLSDGIKTGQFTLDDLAWIEGQAEWVPLRNLWQQPHAIPSATKNIPETKIIAANKSGMMSKAVIASAVLLGVILIANLMGFYPFAPRISDRAIAFEQEIQKRKNESEAFARRTLANERQKIFDSSSPEARAKMAKENLKIAEENLKIAEENERIEAEANEILTKNEISQNRKNQLYFWVLVATGVTLFAMNPTQKSFGSYIKDSDNIVSTDYIRTNLFLFSIYKAIQSNKVYIGILNRFYDIGRIIHK